MQDEEWPARWFMSDFYFDHDQAPEAQASGFGEGLLSGEAPGQSLGRVWALEGVCGFGGGEATGEKAVAETGQGPLYTGHLDQVQAQAADHGASPRDAA